MNKITAEKANHTMNAQAAMLAGKYAEQQAKNWAKTAEMTEAKREEAARAFDYMERQKEAFLMACEANRSARAELKEWEHATEQAKERAKSAHDAALEWVAIVPEQIMLEVMAENV